jgi:hypothetical protein
MTPPDRRSPPATSEKRPPAVRCGLGDTLCHVHVLSESEWEALPEASRPSTAEYYPGLGWVVATPGPLRQDRDA